MVNSNLNLATETLEMFVRMELSFHVKEVGIQLILLQTLAFVTMSIMLLILFDKFKEIL